MEMKEENRQLVKKSEYPKAVIFIISNEFCERFSFFGLRAILVLYFMDYLGLGKSMATGLFHLLIVLCYTMPILGAVIADGYIGKYRTIKYLSGVYVVGEVIMVLTAFPPAHWVGPLIGLTLIAVGTGGIKPCVSAFGGDQFKDDQKRERDIFFSLFYLAINLGSFLAMIFIPVLKDQVYCFERKCYSLAFSLPAILMIVSLGLFVWGQRFYTIVPASGSVISNFIKCIFSALKNRFRVDGWKRKKEHLLDYADPLFNNSQLQDFKQVFKILILFLPFPLFWSLYDQMGSRWTLQSIQLDRKLGSNFHLLAEQVQAVNCILIVFFIPFFEFCVYPCLHKLHIPNRLLQRLAMGMLFAALSFVASGILQLTIDKNNHPSLEKTNSQVTFINFSPCDLDVRGSMPSFTLPSYKITKGQSVQSLEYHFRVSTLNNKQPASTYLINHPINLMSGSHLKTQASFNSTAQLHNTLKHPDHDLKRDKEVERKQKRNERLNETTDNPLSLPTPLSSPPPTPFSSLPPTPFSSLPPTLSYDDMRSSRWVVANSNAQIVIGNVSGADCSTENLVVSFSVSFEASMCYYLLINIGDRANVKKWRSVHRELIQVNNTYINDTFEVSPITGVPKDAVNDEDGALHVKERVYVMKKVEEEEEEGGGYEEPPHSNHLVLNTYKYDLNKEPTGESYVRILLVGTDPDDIDQAHLVGVDSGKNVYYSLLPYRSSPYVPVSPGRYTLVVQKQKVGAYEFERIEFKNGGKYSVIINKHSDNIINTMTLIDLSPNDVSIWLQLPQYVLISIGEALFSVSGLLFAYSQAPASMKSVVQAFWLLCTAVGNLIDVLVTSAKLISDQAMEFFFFSIVTLVTTVIFSVMANFYHYVEQTDALANSTTSPNDNKSNYDSTFPIISSVDDAGGAKGGKEGEMGEEKVDEDGDGGGREKDGEKEGRDGLRGYIYFLQNHISNLTR